MQLTLITLAAIVTIVAALPGGGGYGSTTTYTTPVKATHTSTGTTCTPTTVYSTSVGYTEKPSTICTTEKSPFMTTIVSYKTIETYGTMMESTFNSTWLTIITSSIRLHHDLVQTSRD
jgi:hypothetical protein